MNSVLRGAMVICALLMLIFVTHKLRKSQFDTTDSLFWLFVSGCLLIIAIFPGIAYFFSNLLGIQSPSNFVFLAVIGLLMIREFTIQTQLAQLRRKTAALTQDVALHRASAISSSTSKGDK